MDRATFLYCRRIARHAALVFRLVVARWPRAVQMRMLLINNDAYKYNLKFLKCLLETFVAILLKYFDVHKQNLANCPTIKKNY